MVLHTELQQESALWGLAEATKVVTINRRYQSSDQRKPSGLLEDCGFQASLGYMGSPSLSTGQTQTRKCTQVRCRPGRCGSGERSPRLI